jgi:hypothetical protein
LFLRGYTDDEWGNDRLPDDMAEERILEAIGIGIDQAEDTWTDVRFGTEHGVWWKCGAAGVHIVGVEPGSLADRLRSFGKVLNGTDQDGAQALLQVGKGHGGFQVVKVNLPR